MVFQQMTGINNIMFYAENIFEQAHFEVKSLSVMFVSVLSFSVISETQSDLWATYENYLKILLEQLQFTLRTVQMCFLECSLSFILRWLH